MSAENSPFDFAVTGSRQGLLETSDLHFIFHEGLDLSELHLRLTPVGNVLIFPVDPFRGKELTEKDQAGALVGDYLSIYTPMSKDGDLILVSLLIGKTENRRTFESVMQFSEGRWNELPLGTTIDIDYKGS